MQIKPGQHQLGKPGQGMVFGAPAFAVELTRVWAMPYLSCYASPQVLLPAPPLWQSKQVPKTSDVSLSLQWSYGYE